MIKRQVDFAEYLGYSVMAIWIVIVVINEYICVHACVCVTFFWGGKGGGGFPGKVPVSLHDY